jgi:hypothetical protein
MTLAAPDIQDGLGAGKVEPPTEQLDVVEIPEEVSRGPACKPRNAARLSCGDPRCHGRFVKGSRANPTER